MCPPPPPSQEFENTTEQRVIIAKCHSGDDGTRKKEYIKIEQHGRIFALGWDGIISVCLMDFIRQAHKKINNEPKGTAAAAAYINPSGDDVPCKIPVFSPVDYGYGIRLGLGAVARRPQ